MDPAGNVKPYPLALARGAAIARDAAER